MSKTVCSLVCVIVAVSMLFSFPASAVDGAQSPSGEIGFFELIADFFEAVFAKIYELFKPGFSYIDVEDYTTELFEIPGLDDDFVPQGLCFVEALNSFAVSGYSSAGGEGDEALSRIYLINNDTKAVKKLLLLCPDGTGFDYHAGGIACNGSDVWVASGGCEKKGGYAYHITADVLAQAQDGAKVQFDGRFQTEAKASYMYCDGEMLWIGEFYNKDNPVNPNHSYGKNSAICCGYELPVDVDYTAEEQIAPDALLSIPDQVQGMSFADNGEVVFSTSYGRRNNSVMHIYSDYKSWKTDTAEVFGTKDIPLYIADSDSRITKITMPTLMEAFDYYNGKLYLIFESGAQKYSDARRVIKTVWETDINAVIGAVKNK